MKSKGDPRSRIFQALSLIFDLQNTGNTPKDMGEVIRLVHPNLKDLSTVAETREYQNLCAGLRRSLKWLRPLFVGKYRDKNRERYPEEEVEVIRALEQKFSSFQSFAQELNRFMAGRFFHSVKREVPRR